MLVGILKNQNIESADKWIAACQKIHIDYRSIDLTSMEWLDRVRTEPFDFFLTRPPGDIERFKIMYDERLYIIAKILNYKIYPSYEECLIYENKKMAAYYFAATGIPHPHTLIFYNFEQAVDYAKAANYPIVAKSSIGAAGSGVKIIYSKKELNKYFIQAFKKEGIRRRFGPNRVTGSPSKWFLKALSDPSYFKKKWKSYIERYKDAQIGYVILQDYIPHEFEWRVARIGDSYFAYKKLKVGDKSSGVKSFAYENPPIEMMDFIRNLSNEHQITCAAFDLFQVNGKFLVNEIQTLFGHKNDHILEVDGRSGRYCFSNNRWVFEAGDFNANESYDLRLSAALNLFSSDKL